MKRKYFALASVLCLVFLLGAGCSFNKQKDSGSTTNTPVVQKETFVYEADDLMFYSPVKLPTKWETTDVGTYFNFNIDDETNLDAPPLFSIYFSKAPSELFEGVGRDMKQLRDYFRSTYLADAKPAETIKRTAAGQEYEGEKNEIDIPVPSKIEAYVKTLPDGQMVFVGIKYRNEFSDKTADEIITSALSTLQQKKMK
jgi:hypothetical protein